MAHPDRSEFVRWCVQQFAEVADMAAFWRLVDRIQTRRSTIRQEGNREADERISAAVKQAHARFGGKQ